MSLARQSYYVAGGTLPRDAPSYVIRRADNELFEGLMDGRFCYVLTSRQMGKSSLMVRTAGRLRKRGVTCAVLDLTAIGQDLTREQWYDGLQNALGRQLSLEEELDAFWLSRQRLHPLQRWMLALEQVVLKQFEGPIVLFLDEIDAVRSLPFAADEFFAAIREFYNRRAECPALERLTFCLLGVASPSDLIRDTRTTPFNIGLRIDLTDFTREEAIPLASGLESHSQLTGTDNDYDHDQSQHLTPNTQHLLDRILYWTGGHPYLTQRLCHAVSVRPAHLEPASAVQGPELVDAICGQLLISAQARVQNDNLLFVRDRLLRSEVDVTRLLSLYSRIHRGRCVRDDEADPLISVLRLSGITRSEDGRLYVRNRIYSQVFDQAWVAANMPEAEVRRRRAAFRSGVLRATALFGAVIIALSALGVTAKREAESARRATGRMESALKQADAARLLAVKETGRVRQAEGKLAAALKKAEERRLDAERQKRHATDKQADAENARRETAERLRDSYLAQAQASRWSRRIGQKFDSLAALQKASNYPASAEFRMRLRNEAIACLALPIDLRLRRTRKAEFGGTHFTIDGQVRRLATVDNEGNSSVWDLETRTLLGRYPGTGKSVGWIDFSPGGRFLAAHEQSGVPVRVWDLQRRGGALDVRLYGVRHLAFDRNDSNVFTLADDGAVRRRNLHSGVETRVAEVTAGPRARLRLSPDGRWLACYTIRSKQIRVIDLAGGPGFSLEANARLIQLAWSQDSSKIAAAIDDFSLVVWNVHEKRVLSQIGGHLALPDKLTFLQQDRLLASSARDSTLRISDVATGREVLSVPIGGFAYRFSPDGRSLYLAGNGTVKEYDVDPGTECRVFAHLTGVGNYGIDFLRGSTLMVTGGEDGLRFWDIENGREQAHLPTGSASQALFTPDTSCLVRWDGIKNELSVSRVRLDSKRNRVRIGWPFAARRAEKMMAIRCSADGSRLVTADDDSLSILDLPGISRQVIRRPHKDTSHAAVSPDKRWAASSGHDATNVKIWDVRAGRCVKELPTGILTNVVFSPEGRWLITGNAYRFQFWRVGAWIPEREVPRAPGMGLPGPIAFSDDGEHLALGCSQNTLHLVDSDNGALIARLEGPSEDLLTAYPRFSPDGAYLAAGTECGAVYLWDLRRIRARLAKMGLDWDHPPIPAKLPSHPLNLVFDPLP